MAKIDDDAPFVIMEQAAPLPPSPDPEDHVFVLDTGEQRDREITESVTVRDGESIEDDVSAPLPETQHHRGLGWATKGVLMGVALVIVLSLTDWVVTLATTGTALGVLGAMAASMIILGLGALALSEMRLLSRLRDLGTCRKDLSVEHLPEGRAETRQHLDTAARRLATIGPFADDIAEWKRAQVDIGTPRDMFGNFERVVLRRADEQAIGAIRRGSRDAMAMVVLSPNTALDALAFLVVGLRMTRQICQAYGLRPTNVGAVRILRQALTGAAMVGVVDSAVDMGAQMMGEAVVGKISGAIAGGATASLKMARLGICVMETIRPLDHVGTTAPTILSCYRPVRPGA